VFTTFSYTVGDLALSLRWNFYPDIDPASKPLNPTTRDRGVFQSYNLYSLSGQYRVSDVITLRGGIDNVFDKAPPLSGGSWAADGGWTGAAAPAFPTLPSPSSNATYDQFGRRFYVGASVAF
jgi:iron complex outermembrane receptor protein